MSDILMDMLKDRVDEAVNAAERRLTVGHLSSLMARQGCTASQAMDLLGIPEKEREAYAELVGKREQ